MTPTTLSPGSASIRESVTILQQSGDLRLPIVARYDRRVIADDATCYRHPDRTAAVGCQRCDRPICPDCMRPASVGYHCPECTKSGAQKVYRPSDLVSKPMATFVIMGLCVFAFLAQMATGGTSTRTGTVTRDFVLFGPLIAEGEWWRAASGGFLHGGLLHIAFNMYALYLFGPMLEKALGKVRFVAIYLGGLAGGSLGVVAFNWDQPTLGASGAVLGLAGALAAVLASQGRSIFQTGLGGIFLINLLLPLIPGFRISFWGHFGGIAGGFLVAGVISQAPKVLGRTAAAQNVAIGLAAALVVVMFGAVLAVANAGGLVSVNI